MDIQISNLLPAHIIHALGTTLFYSLLFGVALALVTGLIIICTRSAVAKTRYCLLTSALGLFVLAVGIVFINAILPAANASGQAPQLAEQILPGYNSDISLQSIAALWNSWALQIVWIWFLVVGIKGIQLCIGLSNVYYLKRTQTFDAGTYWNDKLAQIAESLEVQPTVKLLQSALAKTPMVIGYFKPVILIPIGLFSNLSTEAVAAILSHELAHIKRRDYLVNLLQSFVELLFFFNPAVLWLSNLIRAERENCCDDLALQYTKDKAVYVEALLACQEYQLENNRFVMALSGRKKGLVARATRMLLNSHTTLNKMEKTVLGLVLGATLIVATALNNPAESNAAVLKIQQDTTKKIISKNSLGVKEVVIVENVKKTGTPSVDALKEIVIEENKPYNVTKSGTIKEIQILDLKVIESPKATAGLKEIVIVENVKAGGLTEVKIDNKNTIREIVDTLRIKKVKGFEIKAVNTQKVAIDTLKIINRVRGFEIKGTKNQKIAVDTLRIKKVKGIEIKDPKTPTIVIDTLKIKNRVRGIEIKGAKTQKTTALKVSNTIKKEVAADMIKVNAEIKAAKKNQAERAMVAKVLNENRIASLSEKQRAARNVDQANARIEKILQDKATITGSIGQRKQAELAAVQAQKEVNQGIYKAKTTTKQKLTGEIQKKQEDLLKKQSEEKKANLKLTGAVKTDN